MQIKRTSFINELIEERFARKLVREAIKIVEFEDKEEEHMLRDVIKQMITEAKPNEMKVHDETGMNYLENLFSNTNFLEELKGGFAALTTDIRQRNSFASHVLNAMEGLLARDTLNRREDDEARVEKPTPSTLKATPGEAGMSSIDVNITDKKEEKPKKKEEEGPGFKLLPGMDETGGEAAMRTWKVINPLIQNELVRLRNPKDEDIFKEYLVKNVKLYFEEWGSAATAKSSMTPV
tara:strand:- start:13778 stop:14485 length:708 start_codon:yes stop_codon:yes gene_type:complete